MFNDQFYDMKNYIRKCLNSNNEISIKQIELYNQKVKEQMDKDFIEGIKKDLEGDHL